METAEKCRWISRAQSRNEELPETKFQIYYGGNKGKLAKQRFKSGESWMTTSADVSVEVNLPKCRTATVMLLGMT